jgi:FkbM family methyltransferase
VVLDVGANLGLFALRVLEVAPRARLFCFEPVATTFGCLRRNVGERAHCTQLALAEASGPLELSYFPRSPGNATAHPELKLDEARAFADGATLSWVWRFDKLAASLLALFYRLRRWILRRAFARVYEQAVKVEVEATTLDRVIADGALASIDLLKIDIEGSERAVLAGLSDDNLRRVKQLVVEITPSYKCELIPLLERRLRACGFEHVAVRGVFRASDARTDAVPCTLYARRALSLADEPRERRCSCPAA